MTPAAISDRRLGLATISVVAFWMFLVVYAAYPALPFSPVRSPLQRQLGIATMLPEGWAFFTRDPREPRTWIYARGPRGWAKNSLWPHSRLRNLFGLNRESRSQGVELGSFLNWMNGRRWAKCHDEVTTCLERVPVLARLRNRYERPTLCGTVGLVMQPPVPWAWSTSPHEVIMPSAVVKLEITC